jgi:6-phosphogluconolactonase
MKNGLHFRGTAFLMTAIAILAAGSPAALGQIVGLSPKAAVFSSQVVGTSSMSKNVILINTDNVNALTISSVTASGNFTQTNTCGSGVASLATCTITIKFTPTSATALLGAITIADNAPGSPHIIGLTGTGIRQVTTSASSLAFGTVPIGTTSSAKTVKVTNNSANVVNITSITPSADYVAVPSLTNGCGTSLAAKASCSESVTFTPTQAGSINGALLITDTAANSPQVVTLTGTGSGSNGAPITISPPSLAFGKQLVGGISGGKALTIKNIGTNSLGISISASGEYSETPSGGQPCGANLAGGASCTVTVTFSPATVASINGSIAVAYSGTDSPQVATLTGTGIGPLSTSLSSLNFPAQQVLTTSSSTTVKLTNNTAGPITIASITPTGNYGVLMGMGTDCGGSLNPGANCNVRVVFAPTHSGTVLGAFTVIDSATNSPQIVGLSAIGMATPRFGYGSHSNLTETTSYTVDPTTGSVSITGQVSPNGEEIAVDPTSRFLFSAGMGTNTLSVFSVDSSTGVLTTVAGSPFPAGAAPFSVAVDPSGRFIYVPNQSGNNLSAYSIDLNTGAPKQLTGSPYAVGNTPQASAVDPTGRFLYVPAEGSSNISAFSLNPTTGILTAVLGSPFSDGNTAEFVAIEPRGKFLYVSNFGNNDVSAFAINSVSGALTPAKGSPFVAGTGPQELSVDPSGRFLYVSNLNGGGISGYMINQTSGALTQMQGSPFGSSGRGLTSDPSGKFLYNCSSGGGGLVFSIDQSTGVLTQISADAGIQCDLGIALTGAVP